MPEARRLRCSGNGPRRMKLPRNALRSTTTTTRSICGRSSSPASRFASKQGPDGYQLAHLFDHKEHGNRWRDELDLPPHTDEPAPLYGLFTSAANSVYAPGAFLRPTDFSPRLRSLIQRRALQLYGGICCVVPPPLAVKPCEDPSWTLDNFRWSAPVGGMDHVPDFLAFRRERTGELIDKRHADRRQPVRHRDLRCFGCCWCLSANDDNRNTFFCPPIRTSIQAHSTSCEFTDRN